MTPPSRPAAAWHSYAIALASLLALLALPLAAALGQRFRPAELWICTGGDGDLPAILYRGRSGWNGGRDHLLLPGGYAAVRQLAAAAQRHGLRRIETLCLPPGPGQNASTAFLLDRLKPRHLLITGTSRPRDGQGSLAIRAAAGGGAVWQRRPSDEQPLHWRLDHQGGAGGDRRTWSFAHGPMLVRAESLSTGEFNLLWQENGQTALVLTLLPCNQPRLMRIRPPAKNHHASTATGPT